LKSLSSWFTDFKERVEFLRSWMQATPSGFWISCFFFPQGLLTAILQTYARKTKVPIDTLAFKFKVVDTEKEKLVIPKDGAYIYGLFFAGARWDSGKDTIADEKPG
jgi:dynein heavy chain